MALRGIVYRVNYGNGQVSDCVQTKREAFRMIANDNTRNDPYAGLYFVQWRDPETGDWFNTGTRA